MAFIQLVFRLLAGLWLVAGVCAAASNEDVVGDAYARGSLDGTEWAIGSKTIELVFQAKDGQFRLISFKNRTVQPPVEYLKREAALAPFAFERSSLPAGDTVIQSLWEKNLKKGEAADPASENLSVTVKKGDRIGFSVEHGGNYASTTTRWPVTIAYDTGERYASTEDSALGQGPMWFYDLLRVDTGILAPLDEFMDLNLSNEKGRVRVASQASGYRTAGEVPWIGPSTMHPSPTCAAARIWVAPKDGTVQVKGSAALSPDGTNPIKVNVFEVRKMDSEARRAALQKARERATQWTLESAKCLEIDSGGRPAVQLDMVLFRASLRVDLHIVAFPHTSVLRQWLDVENTGTTALAVSEFTGVVLPLESDVNAEWQHSWMTGADNSPNAGVMRTAPVKPGYRNTLSGGVGCMDFIPYMVMRRNGAANDGWFAEQDNDSSAKGMSVTRDDSTTLVQLRGLKLSSLAAKQKVQSPAVTLCSFAGDLDDMAEHLYTWQYEYMWDYTHHDWFGRMLWAPGWYNNPPNLQENWAGRLNMDLTVPDLMRTAGMTLLWDDAGWSLNADNYFVAPFFEGPDFANTVRYLAKMDMKWLLWFNGYPSPGVMDNKVAAWGNFQWRTDFNDWSDRAQREQVSAFLKKNLRASFHTTNCGSKYSHMFEVQRRTDINMLADPGWGMNGGGMHASHYLSYFEIPDKWMDIMPPFYSGGRYRPEDSRQSLALVPCWDQSVMAPDLEQIRRMGQIYNFLTREGVCGRWSLMFHPAVTGDGEQFYMQRTSYDRKKACIVLRHVAPGAVTIFPRGLLPNYSYAVGFDSKTVVTTRTGTDLMAKGIVIEKQAPGELVYLGLPNRPGSGTDTAPSRPPSRVLSHRESNIGHAGVGIYWSPGSDDNWLSYYEIRRGETVLGKASVGTYFFDHSEGWDPSAPYAVRTVDGDGNVSEWTTAKRAGDATLEYPALGGLFSTAGRDGWSAETTTDGTAFKPMQWIVPADSPAGNRGGTPRQRGGAEGYWEGEQTARVGRGWQQASVNAQCIRAWTAPQPGTVRIVGRLVKEYQRRAGPTLRVRILLGMKPVWPKEGWAEAKAADLLGSQHDLTLEVAKGDVVRFVLDRASTDREEIVSWMPRIIYADEKPQIALGDSVVRILCGATQPYTDKLGNVWSRDRFFTGGAPVQSKEIIASAQPTHEDQALYQAGRVGKDFTYAIPVSLGIYSIHLKFAETQYKWFFERPMNLDVNGRRVLTNFDVCQAARGAKLAYEKILHCLTPDAEGLLVLHFTGGWEPTKATDEAMVQAIEVLPEIKPEIHVDCGSDKSFVDWNGVVWSPDRNVTGGSVLEQKVPVSQASPTMYDQALYHTARSGKSLTYRFAAPPGLYAVHLKFAELWLTEAGKRPMNIDVNGLRVRENWDPATAAGQINAAADVRVEDITPDKNGEIIICITATGENDAILQGIEIE
jgi:hypothetical protein